MTSAQLHTSMGSAPLLSGTPVVLSEVDEMLSDIKLHIANALVELAGDEKTNLMKILNQHPDWAEFVNDVSVSVSDKGLAYLIHGDDANDLEYGNPQKDIAATGMVRGFAKRRSYELGHSLVNKIWKVAGRG